MKTLYVSSKKGITLGLSGIGLCVASVFITFLWPTWLFIIGYLVGAGLIFFVALKVRHTSVLCLEDNLNNVHRRSDVAIGVGCPRYQVAMVDSKKIVRKRQTEEEDEVKQALSKFSFNYVGK